MGTKGNKRAPRRSPRESGLDRASQATYIRRRDDKISELYFVYRLTRPPVIYDELLTFCRECRERKARHDEKINDRPIIGCESFTPLITTNRQSGLRIVETVIKRIREEALPEEILALRRPIETEKVKRTYERLIQLQMAIVEDESTVRLQKMSSTGTILYVVEPRYSQLDKARAAKRVEELNEKLGRLGGAILVAVEDIDPTRKPGEDVPDRQQGFNFVFPNVKGSSSDLNEMVAMNLERAKVN